MNDKIEDLIDISYQIGRMVGDLSTLDIDKPEFAKVCLSIYLEYIGSDYPYLGEFLEYNLDIAYLDGKIKELK